MKIRRLLLCALIFACLAWPALAEHEISMTLSAEEIAAESPLDFSVTAPGAQRYRYTLLHEGKELFSTETTRAAGAYLPRKEGEYTLRAAAVYADGEAETEADFTVAGKLVCSLSGVKPELQAGDAVKPQVQAEGGTGEYRYLYTVAQQGKTILRQEGGTDWHWTAAEGEYELLVTVVDASGASASGKTAFSVSPGPGISLEAAGGELAGHGGQKSWTVYAPGSWTAHTTADFITLESSSGSSGGTLTATATGPAAAYREGVITITSGAVRVEWPVAQQAGHGVDEEVYLFAPPQTLLVDGGDHAVWTGAQDSRVFQVTASGDWAASTDSDFIHLQTQADRVTVTVDASYAPVVRGGTVLLSGEGASAYIHVYQLPAAAQPQRFENAPDAPWDHAPVYSQFSGLWKEKKYGASTLEHSGCAIFALSHALQLLGFEGESILPEALAAKYAFTLRDGGTINSTLVGNAGDDLGFRTRYDLYTDAGTIRKKLDEGAVFSFAVVSGHIAMVAERSEDGSMLRIIDSAPSATWERIKGAQLYRREADGSFTAINDLSQLEGIRYYVENDAFGGASYWLETSYVARRGVRLIQPDK